MKTHQVVMTVICAVAVSGCATITRGSKDLFGIESEPTGATVELSNGLNCVTPCAMELPRKHAFTATFSLEGHKPLTAESESVNGLRCVTGSVRALSIPVCFASSPNKEIYYA